MSLTQILIMGFVALLLRFVFTGRWRTWGIMAFSVVAIYILQPAMPIRWMDFWLPTITIGFSVIAWIVTARPENRNAKDTWMTGAVVSALILLVGLTRYISVEGLITASRPPQIGMIVAVVLFFAVITIAFWRFVKPSKAILSGLIVFIILLFIVIKQPDLTLWLSKALRLLNGQDIARASALDVRWFGFSYIAFRIIHTMRERQNGRLLDVELKEYLSFIFFYPALPAGPIDRLDRFVKDLRIIVKDHSAEITAGGQRILIGIFKKFVIADALSLISINPFNAGQVNSTGWQWVLVYAYAFQIFMDFSGYTDIAIGLGRWIGIKLPENFNLPYLKNNLGQFWNNWHMTLTMWFRAYFFNPITRAMKVGKLQLPATAIFFIAQVSTMLLIAFWHGMSWNFAIWGLWHGVGLFVQNRWTEKMRPQYEKLERNPRLYKALDWFSIFLTFNYVALGWVWFALPDVQSSLVVFKRLLGL